VCMLLGFIVLCLTFRREDDRSVVALAIYLVTGYVSLVYIVSQAEARYSIPLRPEMYLCAAYFLHAAARGAARRKRDAGARAVD